MLHDFKMLHVSSTPVLFALFVVSFGADMSPPSQPPGSTPSWYSRSFSPPSPGLPPPVPFSADCPRACFCNTLNRIVYCSRRGLAVIPDGIPADSVQLNFNGNAFQSSSIRRSNFSRFVDLEHLYLSECGIERVEVGVFSDLTSLKWLDMSNNRIKTIDDLTFRGSRLQHLFLNGNRHIRLSPSSFEGLSTTGLYLHDCSLNELQPEVLQPLSESIRYLWLNGNELDRLDGRMAAVFSSLLHLRLNSNPLRCDCDAMWLKGLYDRSAEMFKGAPPPSCLTPQRLKGRLFNESSTLDFSCSLPMFTHVEATFNGSAGRLRCAALGDPAPTIYWIQPSGRITVFDRPPDGEVLHNEGLLVLDGGTAGGPGGGGTRYKGRGGVGGVGSRSGEVGGNKIGETAGFYGMFICIATNIAGNVTFSIDLPRPIDKNSNDNNNTVLSSEVGSSAGRYAASPTPEYPILYNNNINMNTRQQQRSTAASAKNIRTLLGGQSSDNEARNQGVSGPPTALQRLNIGASGGTGRAESRGGGVGPVLPPVSSPIPSVLFVETSRRSTHWSERMFTLSELVSAAVGTHILTIIIYLVVVGVCYWARCKARRHIRRVHQRNASAASHLYFHEHQYCDGGGVGRLRHDRGGKSPLSTLSPCGSLLPPPPPEAVRLNGLVGRRYVGDYFRE